ncbi:MAG: hypothetical protein ABW044_07265 [Cellvibrio sp.]
MTQHDYMLLGLVLGLFVVAWLAIKFIIYLRGKKHNTELWGTIFEGVTNKLVNLDPVKKPDVFIEKKARQSGLGDSKQPKDQ